jgi:hypothetical protein
LKKVELLRADTRFKQSNIIRYRFYDLVHDSRDSFNTGDLPFLVFRNVATSRVGVIYRREDGELGHMEATNEV